MKTYSHTPLLRPRQSSKQSLWFKMDCYQTTGSFKIRGMDRLVAHHIAAGRTRFISSSGGNAGFSAAYAARLRGGDCTVVVPESTGERMRDLIRQQGAEVIVHGPDWNGADALTQEMAAEQGLVYVSPFEDPLLWEGHSTLVDELVADLEAQGAEFPKRMVVSVGGGGLLIGILQGLERHGLLDQVELVAAETAGAASFAASASAGKLVSIDRIETVAKTLGARQVSPELWRWHSEVKPIQSFICSDAQALAGVRSFAEQFGIVVEPSCGAALSAIAGGEEGAPETLVMVCGGIGWSLQEMESVTG